MSKNQNSLSAKYEELALEVQRMPGLARKARSLRARFLKLY